MSSLVQLRQEFKYAAKAATLDESLRIRPSFMIEDQTFHDIFDSVQRVFENGRVYSGNEQMDIPGMIEECRHMCLEAYTTSSRQDEYTRNSRTELLNALQCIKETAEEYGVDENGKRAADMWLSSLHEYADVIREAAVIHREYLHNEDIAQALFDIARNTGQAYKRLLYTNLPDNLMAADDYDY